MTTPTPDLSTVRVPDSDPIHDHPGAGGRRRLLLLLAGVGFAVSWFAGLSVFSSSTQVRSSGAQIQLAYAGHVGVVGLQYLLTEGLPAVFLVIVTLSLARAVRAAARSTRSITAIAGLTAAGVSAVQLALGLWLSFSLVDDAATDTIGTVYRAVSRLDGVKMLLLAVLAVAMTRAIRRCDVDLPSWLAWTAAALAVTITISGIGYLTLNNTLATAAWVSLPCLIVFVTGAAVVLNRR
ncbi:MAG: hypothetical protein ACR2P2_01175 [Nakamurella sp.]